MAVEVAESEVEVAIEMKKGSRSRSSGRVLLKQKDIGRLVTSIISPPRYW